MGDVKDILGLGRESTGADGAREAPKKDKKELLQRPKGMSREAFNLLHGSHHIQQGDLLKEFTQKEEQKAASFTKTTYQLLPFANEARKDNLRLRHWVQCYKDAAGQMRPVDDGPYPFAKFNVPVGAVKFDAIEYENVIRPKFPEADSGWSKEETEYLLDLCAQYDLRFAVVADRYRYHGSADKARAVEDLKARYYAIAAELAKARAGEPLLAMNQPLVKQPYDAQRERERRAALRLSLQRTPLQAEEEDRVLAAAERISDARKRAASAARPGGAPLLHPESFSNDVSAAPFFDRAVTAVAPAAPGAYLRRSKLEEAKKQATNHSAQSGKALKLLEGVLADTAGVGAALPATCTRATAGAYLALYSESLHLVDLKQRTQLRGAGGGGGGGGGKGLAQGDEGRGKRQVKVKAPRYEGDVSPAPAPKRRR